MAEVSATTPQRVQEYETIYILRPDIDSDGASRVSSRVSEVVARENGTLVKVESWGRRKLAYPVRKFRRGIYYYLRYVGGGHIVAEFERNLRMQKDAVLKFQTIKVRDEVDPAELSVNPEELKFAPIEPITDEERDESREKMLGLLDVDFRRDDRREREEFAAADVDDDSGDDVSSADDKAEEK